MILGLTLQQFIAVHIAVSIVAIITGLIVFYGALSSRRLPGLTALFLATTILTSVTGFLFPSAAITPAQIFGYISLSVLFIAVLALYVFHLRGAWRWIYLVTGFGALYLNTFVLVVQSFQKVPSFNHLAPTGSEPAFFIAQGVLFAAFLLWAAFVVRRFHPERAVNA